MRRSFVLGAAFLFLLSGCDSGSNSVDPNATVGSSAIRGCTVDQMPPIAPGGYYTNGTTVCTADGTPHLFRGVARPSMEWGPGENITADDFANMGSWHANVVRIALNQDFWLSGAALYNPNYQQTVDDAIRYAEHAGLDVILDLHWSDRGNLNVGVLQGQDRDGTSNQQQMADVNSKQFWLEVATKYKNDGHVLFELYNEPNGISTSIWLKGGMATGFQVVGMQELYDTVRTGAGANNIVIAGGLSYAFDLSGVGTSPIDGYNVMYASHPYKPQDPEARWETAFGFLATRDVAPVITTEFGDTQSNCTGQWDTDLIKFNDDHKISWTAWAWYPSGCNFPALISDWVPTTTVQGDAVKAALLAYDYQPGGNTSISLPGEGAAGAGQAGAAGANATGEGGASGEGGAGGNAGGQ